MAKQRKSFSFRIPPYATPRLEWRRRINHSLKQARKENPVCYDSSDKLEIDLRLYMRGNELSVHDLDNRLKDILDTLQGRMGGPKSIKPKSPLIPNDHQIWRIVAVKSAPPKQSHDLGHLAIRRYRR